MVQTVPLFVSQWRECTAVVMKEALSVSMPITIQLLTVPHAFLATIPQPTVLDVSLVET